MNQEDLLTTLRQERKDNRELRDQAEETGDVISVIQYQSAIFTLNKVIGLVEVM